MMYRQSTSRPVAAIGVAASAGGVEALTAFVRALPRDFPAAVLVVLHVPDAGPSYLPSILARVASLPVMHASDGAPLRGGMVIVAPPGQHLLVRNGRTDLDHGPRENGHRPSADALFRSIASEFGRQAAAIVLSGTMDDGSAGLRAVALVGGLTIAQDPEEAAFPAMPVAAAAQNPSVICRVGDMANNLVRWIAALPHLDAYIDRSAPESVASENPRTNDLSEFTCPECGGTLFVDHTLGTERFRCRVGHNFSTRALLLAKQAALEAALWAAVVALEERGDLWGRLLATTEERGRPSLVQGYRNDIEQSAARVAILRGFINDLVRYGLLPTEDEDDDTDAAE